MNNITEFLKTDIFLYILFGGLVLLLILYIANLVSLNKTKKEYKNFMKKLANGKDLDEMLRKYIQNVEKVNEKNVELEAYCKKLDNDMTSCLQKVGIVRYSAFKDMGSDLSFALAILDEKNDGIVLNGIYSREISNIYAKPITNGTSKYTISEEEKQAIDIAIGKDGTIKIKE